MKKTVQGFCPRFPPQDPKKQSARHAFLLLHPDFMILLRRYLSILVKKGWAHELDHTGGGTGHVVHDRAGRGLSVRALHTRRGKLRKRERPPAPLSELLS